jgi:hypothetical protein
VCKICGTFGNTGAAREKSSYTYTSKGNSAEIDLQTEKRIRTADDLIKALDLDTKTWTIERFTVSKSEGYRKDKKVDWRVENGRTSGYVHDTGDLLIKPLFSVKVWLRRRTREIRNELVATELKHDLNKFAYRYRRIAYPKCQHGGLYEIAMPDLQLGRLVMSEEAGVDSSPDLYISAAESAKN